MPISNNRLVIDPPHVESDNLKKLYSELKKTKPIFYESECCYNNVEKLINHLQVQDFFIQNSLKDRIFVIYFYNDGIGGIPYGERMFGWHVNLLYVDSKNVQWYIIDYDIESISGRKHPLDSPISVNSYLKLAFSNYPMLSVLNLAKNEGNYYPLTRAQQLIIFSLEEFHHIKVAYSRLPFLLQFCFLHRNNPENILHNLYQKFGLSFNNLYEFFKLIEGPTLTDNPIDSIQTIRKYYNNRPLSELTCEGFSNSRYRLGEVELSYLINAFSQPYKEENILTSANTADSASLTGSIPTANNGSIYRGRLTLFSKRVSQAEQPTDDILTSPKTLSSTTLNP